MPSTYTELKIELIANGEQSGTWGTTTNTNLGTAIEEALVNTSLISFTGADVTLTLVDSSASQPARNMRLNLLGTSGGARNLIVPAIQKNYLVVNNLADAVTVKTPSGTGITIPATNTAFLYVDGTNVLQAFDFIPTAKFNTLTLVNPLAATSGGTGLATYTAGGALYSPTTTTVASGTLPATAGGTGLSTYTSGGAVYASSASTLTTGVLPTSGGGTGLNSFTTGNAIYASSSNTLTNGVLPTTGGGTGLSSFTSGGAVYASSTSALTTGTLPYTSGGTGVSTAPTNGQLLIGNGSGYTLANLIGVGITVSNTPGAITLTTSGLYSGGPLGTPSSGTLTNCTADGTNNVGYQNVPVNSQSAAYTAVLSDAGKVIFHPSTDANARTFTIPSNASVPYPTGTVLTFINMTSQAVTISISSDTMYLVSLGSTGNRNLAQYGMATALKMTSTTWIISGSGLT
jgi:hypothetical protein